MSQHNSWLHGYADLALWQSSPLHASKVRLTRFMPHYLKHVAAKSCVFVRSFQTTQKNGNTRSGEADCWSGPWCHQGARYQELLRSLLQLPFAYLFRIKRFLFQSVLVFEIEKQLPLWMCPGRKIAIDASMCMYQFLIAVRQDGNVLQNEDGETTRSLLSRHVGTCQNVDVHSCKADAKVSSLF